jgi:hypothetical protein
MKTIKYEVTVSWLENDKQISLHIFASDDKDLFESLGKALHKDSKWSIRNLLNK